MLDTSALLPALVANHALHLQARAHLPRPEEARLPGIVLAECYARLRQMPFRVSASTARDILAPWARADHVLSTPSHLYGQAIDAGPVHNLGGQIHDYLIVLTCVEHDCDLVTADRRQATLARAVMRNTARIVTCIG